MMAGRTLLNGASGYTSAVFFECSKRTATGS
jgi:hypothetical protein